MRILLVLSLLFLSSCAHPPVKTVESSGILYWRWHNAVEQRCNVESELLTLQIFASKPTMTEDDVIKLKSFLNFSCSKYYGIAL